ncbi:MAG: hypothetical protein AMXMBFR59_35820 [Rhodanobacteraceae bacterium]
MSIPFKPICFVVMPYGLRDTGLPEPAPPRVDFDALWEHALKPVIESAGYRAVRADQDYGALIIKEMLERLYYSDLVVADISLANANAYYEVGVRHAARHSGCVLIAADWSRPVFDLAQVRHLRYPNPDITVTEAGAARIRERLAAHLPDHVDAPSPFQECVPAALHNRTVHDHASSERARQLAGHLEDFERLRAEISAVRLLPTAAQREAAAGLILVRHPAGATTSAPVAIEMLRLFRDVVGAWDRTAAYIEALPETLRQLPCLQEQLALAQSKQGDHIRAIEALERLILLRGDSAERQALIGGRYKRLHDASRQSGESPAARVARRYLDKAIAHYENGMMLDLNGYYASSNLPVLYRERAAPGDEARAVRTAAAARLACERARQLRLDDEWTLHTLIGIAFAERRSDVACDLVAEIERRHDENWKIRTTLKTLRAHVEQMPEQRDTFAPIVARLEALLD